MGSRIDAVTEKNTKTRQPRGTGDQLTDSPITMNHDSEHRQILDESGLQNTGSEYHVPSPLASPATSADPSASAAALSGELPSQSAHSNTMKSSGVMMHVRNLDSLFYVIITVASLGLFGSVYALLNANDAFFEREYALLQKESDALDARLKARLVTDAQPQQVVLNVSAASVGESGAEVSAIDETKLVAGGKSVGHTVVAQADKKDAASAENPPVQSEESPALSDTSTVDVLLTTETLRQSTEQTRMHDELAALQHELAIQGDQLKRLIEENKSLKLLSQKNQAGLLAQGVPVENAVVTLTELTTSVIASDTGLIANSTEQVTASPPASSVIDPDLELLDLINQGYQAYQAMDFALAAVMYDKALQFDPYHRDANLGVAAAARQLGDSALAESRYRHLLSLDPRDATAFSAFLELTDLSSEVESELTLHAQRLYISQPDYSGPLYASLGNYYSRKLRWSDSRWAYSRAVEVAGNEADFLYNLAVVLDNTGEYQLAVDHYRRALSAMATSPYSFDENQARSRLFSLQDRYDMTVVPSGG